MESLTILESLLRHCRPVKLNDPWAGLNNLDAFWGVEDPPAVLAELQSEFSAEQLEQMAVAMASPDGTLQLHPDLSAPDALIVPLRQATGEPPYELLTRSGTLSKSTLPVLAVHADCRATEPGDEVDHVCCVAFAIEDVVVLRALGVSATLATGLERIGGEELQELTRQFLLTFNGRSNLSHGSSDEAGIEREHRPEMILVAWSPAGLSLDRPPALQPVVEHLQKIEDHLDLMLDSIGIWQPTEKDVERLRFAFEYGSQADVRQALADSLENRSFSAIDWHEQPPLKPPEDPPDLLAATRQVRELRRQGGDRSSIQKSWQIFQECLENEVVEPLILEAMASANPIRRNALIALAGLGRVHHLHTMCLAEKLKTGISAPRLEGEPVLATKEIHGLVAVSKQLIELSREVMQCSRPKNRVTLTTTALQKSHPALPDSGSVPDRSIP